MSRHLVSITVLILLASLLLAGCQPIQAPAHEMGADAGSIGHVSPTDPVDAQIANAMSAAPLAVSQDATILGFPAEGTDMVVLREGTNGWTCFTDWPASPANDPQCNDGVWTAWTEAFLKGVEPEVSQPGVAYMLQGGDDTSNVDPFAPVPAEGQEWVSTPPHVMLLVPGNFDSTVFTTDHEGGFPYIMWDGTPYEHLMMPIVPADTGSSGHVSPTDPVDAQIANAMSAAPLAISQDATILGFPAEGSEMVQLREGTNGWTCFTDWPASPANDPQCNDGVWTAWTEAFLKGEEPEVTGPGVAYMLQGGDDTSNVDPFAPAPAEGEEWVSTPPHVMLLVPDNFDSAMFTTDHESGLPYIMWDGTPYEHLMAPVAAMTDHPEPAQGQTGAAAAEAPAADVAPLLGNLGDHHHPITTDSELAQKYFDEGLILNYGFNHAEAIRSYQDALKLDPECAMCYWGIAYALGPNINLPMDPAVVPQAWEALQQAQALAPQASEAEQAYINALAQRYSEDPNADRAALDLAYANAMRELAQAYPDDTDAATLFAESLMDLTPWNFWTKDGQPTQYTNEIVATLEGVLAANPDHPAANHFYIHAVEASPDNERAIPSAERLAHLVPGAGHLVHMPAHTYWRTGRYAQAVEANQHAIHSDETYLPDRGIQLVEWYPAAYYNHNVDFLLTAAEMLGNRELAIDAATKLVEGVPGDLYTQMPFFEYYAPMRLFALARFGEWDQVLQEPQPPAEQLYTTGAWHYVRGLAHVRQGDLDAAAEELAQLNGLAARPEMAEFGLASFVTAQQILQLEAHVLAGELAAAQGDMDQAVAELEAGIALQDSFPYIEPPAWYFPARQSLGQILLDAGRAAEAEAVYREDLAQYPRNGWSLYGLTQSLEAQGKTDEAAQVQAEFDEAWQNADVELTASRF